MEDIKYRDFFERPKNRRFLLVKEGKVYGMSSIEPDPKIHPEYYECKTDDDFKVVSGSFRNEDGSYSLPVIKNNEENPFERFSNKVESCLSGNCELRYRINKYYEEIVKKSTIIYGEKEIKLDGVDIDKVRSAERFLEKKGIVSEKVYIPQYDRENKEFIAHEFSSLADIKGFLEEYDNFVGENVLALSKNISDPKESFREDKSWKTSATYENSSPYHSYSEEELKEIEEKEIRRILERRGFTEEQIQKELSRMRGESPKDIPEDSSVEEKEDEIIEEDNSEEVSTGEDESELEIGEGGSGEESTEEDKNANSNPTDPTEEELRDEAILQKEKEEKEALEEAERLQAEKEEREEREKREKLLSDFNLSYPGLEPYEIGEEAYIVNKLSSGISPEKVYNVIKTSRDNKNKYEEEEAKEQEEKENLEEKIDGWEERLEEDRRKEDEMFNSFKSEYPDLSPFTDKEEEYVKNRLFLGIENEEAKRLLLVKRGESSDESSTKEDSSSSDDSEVEEYPPFTITEPLPDDQHITIDDVPSLYPDSAPYSDIEVYFVMKQHNKGRSKEYIYAMIDGARKKSIENEKVDSNV